MSTWPPPVYIKVFDRTNVLQAIITNAETASWSFVNPGGCDKASFDLPRAYEDDADLGGEYRVEIYYNGTRVWAGVIDEWDQELAERDKITVTCLGYGQTLAQRIVSNETLLGLDVSIAISNLLLLYTSASNQPSPCSEIIVPSFSPTGVTVGNYFSNRRPLRDIINELTLMVQSNGNPWEWGVDENKNFYLRAPSATGASNVTDWAFIGQDVKGPLRRVNGPMSAIKNALYTGGTLTNVGQNYSGVFPDATSIASYGEKDGVVSLLGYNNDTDMQAAITGMLYRSSAILPRVSLTVQRPDDLPVSLATWKIGDVVEIRGFRDGSVYRDRLMNLAFTWKEDGLSLAAQMTATAPDMADMIGRRATANAQAMVHALTPTMQLPVMIFDQGQFDKSVIADQALYTT